jgi:RIO kinase 1
MSSERFLNDKWNKKLDKKLQNLIDRVGVDRKTLDEVFDKSALHSLEKLISDKVIDILDFPISTGKEGNVFRGVTPDKKYVAVKIYRTSTSTFKHISNYIIGDPRFASLPKNRRDIIFAWTRKEFKNLERAYNIGVKVPKPIKIIKNVLVMEYLGDDDSPAPMLKDVIIKDPQDMFDRIIRYISKMYKKAELVHSDMSAFNILIHDNKPYLIDLGQGMLLEHPNALEFLKRDIHNIILYFKKYNVKADEKDIYKKITKMQW